MICANRKESICTSFPMKCIGCEHYLPTRDYFKEKTKALGSHAPELKEEMKKNPVKERNVECSECGGTGHVTPAESNVSIRCPICFGKGYKPKAKNMRS